MRIERIENMGQLRDKLSQLKVEPKDEVHEFDGKLVMNCAQLIISLGRISTILGVILSICAVFLFVNGIRELDIANTVTFLSFGLSLLIFGLLFVAGGRAMTCLVAIERNTRK
jgi:hypothetical protein